MQREYDGVKSGRSSSYRRCFCLGVRRHLGVRSNCGKLLDVVFLLNVLTRVDVCSFRSSVVSTN